MPRPADRRAAGSCLPVAVAGEEPIARLEVVVALLEGRHRARCRELELCVECCGRLAEHGADGAHVPWILPNRPPAPPAEQETLMTDSERRIYLALGNGGKIPIADMFERGDYVKFSGIARISKSSESGPLDLPERTFTAVIDVEEFGVKLHHRPPKPQELPFEETAETPPAPVKRGAGRNPRTGEEHDDAKVTPIKRGRGRPRKAKP